MTYMFSRFSIARAFDIGSPLPLLRAGPEADVDVPVPEPSAT